MVAPERPIYRAIFLFVLAPIGAAVTVGALLLFGAKPSLVFFLGHFVKARLDALGFHAPNSVGVLTTVFFWWVVIVVIGLAWERRRRKDRSSQDASSPG
jgi:hypothetical protein